MQFHSRISLTILDQRWITLVGHNLRWNALFSGTNHHLASSSFLPGNYHHCLEGIAYRQAGRQKVVLDLQFLTKGLTTELIELIVLDRHVQLGRLPVPRKHIHRSSEQNHANHDEDGRMEGGCLAKLLHPSDGHDDDGHDDDHDDGHDDHHLS